MISAIVAFLMSAALLHFGGSAAARPENRPGRGQPSACRRQFGLDSESARIDSRRRSPGPCVGRPRYRQPPI